MTRFEVGKKYRSTLINQVYTCVAKVDDWPVFRGEQGPPWVAAMQHTFEEYVEPKPPIIVERWVNVYQRTTDGSIRTSEPHPSEQAAKEAASFTRISKLIGTIHVKEQFDAV